jgi:hypothetical protein
MSTEPESNFDLDLHFLPAWAKQSSAENRFAEFEGEPGESLGRRRPDREPRRSREGRGLRRDQRGPMRPAIRTDQQTQARPERPARPGFSRHRDQPWREPAAPLPEIDVAILAEEKGVESLARQIKLTGRAYPLFDIAQLILKKPERYTIRFSVIKRADGQVAQALFFCSLDETLWLSEQEAIDHVLNRHFATFYQAERIPTEPPKGSYTFVAQCGMSGVVLGPPNYHDYQTKLRKLHAERFSHIQFDVYKSRVKIVRDEAVVKKWLEEQSFTTEYLCLNVPDTLKLQSRVEVERHFRETHLTSVIQPVEFYTLSGEAARRLPSPIMVAIVRRTYEEQRRFPLKVVTALSQMFAAQGLQFFKVNKTVTHVAVSRPHYLDINTTPVSEGIKQIITFINSNPGCNRRKLIEALAPAPAVLLVAPVITTPTPQEGVVAPLPESPPESAGPMPEMNAVIRDLHWLIHQGHVIEFASGILETAKAPAPKPPKPAEKTTPPAAPVAGALAEPSAKDAQEGATTAETVSAETSAQATAEILVPCQVAESSPAPESPDELAIAALPEEAAPVLAQVPGAPTESH